MPIRFEPSYAKIERYPKISARFLNKLGLMGEGAPRIEIMESHGTQFKVIKHEDGCIEFMTQLRHNLFYAQFIYYYCDKVGATARPFFECAKSGKKCHYLLFLNGEWASREGHGLRVRNGSPEQRRRRALLDARDDVIQAYTTPGKHRSTKIKSLARLHKLLSDRSVLPSPLLPLEEVVDRAGHEEQAIRRNALRSKHPTGRTLAGAISRGCGADGSVELGTFITRPGPNSVESRIQEIGTALRQTALQEDHLRLDLRTLRSTGLMREGKLSARILDVHDIVPNADRALLMVNLRQGKTVVDFVIMDTYPTILSSQSIELTEKPNMPGRHFLRCPIAGTSHDALYFRDGFFASASAQRLKPRSQLI